MLEECDEVDADIGNIYRSPSASSHLPEVCVTDMEDQDLFQMTDFGTPRSVKLRIDVSRHTKSLPSDLTILMRRKPVKRKTALLLPDRTD